MDDEGCRNDSAGGGLGLGCIRDGAVMRRVSLRRAAWLAGLAGLALVAVGTQAATWRGNQIVQAVNIDVSAAAQAVCDGPEWDSPSVAILAADMGIAGQLASIPPAQIAAELEEYGIWNYCEIRNTSDGDNRLRLIWVICQEVVSE